MTRPRATFTVDSTGDEEDAAIGDGLCAVGSGECTLPAAISEANFLGTDPTGTTNLGSLNSLHVSGITDVLPTDTVFVAASPSCVHVSGTVTCTVGDLSTLGTASVSIEVTVGDPPGGQLTNTATVSATEPDPDPSNNSATETTLVVDPLFADGFEDGTTDQWSSTIGG